MKTGSKNIFSLKMALAIMFMVVFGLSVFVSAGVGKKQNAYAETQSAMQQSLEDNNAGTESVVAGDISLYESWEDYIEEPITGAEGLAGSINTNKKLITLTTAGHLAWVASITNSVNTTYKGFDGWTIELQADISLAGKIWSSIGSKNTFLFKGSFNGNGHKITGLTMAPLFSHCNGAKIYDVIIENCVNVSSNALWSGNGSADLYICYSKGVTLAPQVTYHCNSNGSYTPEPAFEGTELEDMEPGLNNAFVWVVVDGANQIIKNDNTGLSNFSIGTDIYKTISSIEVSTLKFNGDNGIVWSRKGYTSSTGATEKGLDDFKINLTFSSAQGSRRTDYTFNSNNGQINITEQYAHQTAIRIKITTRARDVKVLHEFYALSNLDYNTLSGIYSNATGDNKPVSVDKDYFSNVNFISGVVKALHSTYGDIYLAGSTHSEQYGAHGANFLTYIKPNGCVAVGVTAGDYVGNWSDEESQTLGMNADTVKEDTSTNELVMAVKVYFVNMYKVSLRWAWANLVRDMVEIINPPTVYSYKLNDISNMQYSENFKHNVQNLAGIANAYFINGSDPEGGTRVSEAGYNYVYEKAPTNAVSASQNSLNMELQDGGTVSCVWVLSGHRVSLDIADDSLLNIRVLEINPYNNNSEAEIELTESSGRYTTSIRATYKIKILNTTFENATDYYLEVSGKALSNASKIKLGKDATTSSAWSDITTTSEVDPNTQNGQWAEITILKDALSIKVTLKGKEVKFSLDVVIDSGEKQAENVINDITFIYGEESVPLVNFEMPDTQLPVGCKFSFEISYKNSTSCCYRVESLTSSNLAGGILVNSSESSDNKVVFTLDPKSLTEYTTAQLTLCISSFEIEISNVSVWEKNISFEQVDEDTYSCEEAEPTNIPTEYYKNVHLETKAITVVSISIYAENFSFAYDLKDKIASATINGVYSRPNAQREDKDDGGFKLTVSVSESFQIIIDLTSNWKEAVRKGDTVDVTLVLPEYKENGYSMAFICEKVQYDLAVKEIYESGEEKTHEYSEIINYRNSLSLHVRPSQAVLNNKMGDGTSPTIGHYRPKKGYGFATVTLPGQGEKEYENKPTSYDLNCLDAIIAWLDGEIDSLTIVFQYNMTGVTLNIKAKAITGEMLPDGDQVIEGFKPGVEIASKVLDYYSFSEYSTEYESINLDEIDYNTLVEKSDDNCVLELTAWYTTKTYALNFIKDGAVVTSVATNINDATKTISEILESVGGTDYLSQFNRPGYILTFDANGNNFELGNTAKDIIEACSIKDGNYIQEINLVATYTSMPITINFKLNGQSTGLEAYSFNALFGETIDWEAKLSGLNKALLDEQKVVISKWYADLAGNPVVASFDNYSIQNGCVYSYTNWIPTDYTQTYTIIGEYNNSKITANFNGAYLSDRTDKEIDVAFGTLLPKHTDVPTPTRTGYTFAYWKAIDSEGVEHYIYGQAYSGEQNSMVLTFDAVLNFYAYWDVNEVEFEYDLYSEEYDAQEHVINLITLKNIIPDVENKMELYNEYGELVYSSTQTGILIYKAKYVADSGRFYAVYTYSTSFADQSDPASEFYLNEYYSTLTSDFVEIEIAPKQLEITEEITKQYDGETAVIQEIVGVFDIDKNEYKISANYKNANANSNIDIEYSVDCVNTLIANSYSIPQKTQGEITPREIIVDLSGAIKYSGQDNDSIIVAQGIINDTGVIINSSRGIVEFKNEAYIASLLTDSRELSFVIKTNNSQVQIFDLDEFVVELLEENGQNSTDFVLVIENSTFEVEQLSASQRSFTFYAVIHESHPNVRTYDISEFVYNISMDNSRGISDFAFNVVFDNVNIGDLLSFAILVDFKDANWWLLDAIVVNKETQERETISINLFEDGTANFTQIASENKYYDVYLQFTNISTITYELGYIDLGEMQNVIPETTQVQYGVGIELPTPSRRALGFDRWFYIDYAEQPVLLSSTSIASWSIKGDVTLYALWNYQTTITISGSDINAEYGPDKFYNLTASNMATTNSYLEYEHVWKKSSTIDGTYIPLEDSDGSIELHNVADSGYYTFEFNITNIPLYLGKYASISLENVTIVNNKKFSINIYNKELSLLNNIDKQYDGEIDYVYELTQQDVPEQYAELIGQKVVITYTSSDIGATIASISAHENSYIAKNYALQGEGSLVKREINLVIGDTSFEFNNNYASRSCENVDLPTIKISNIVVRTNSVNKGLYTQASEGLIVEFDAVLIKNGQSVNKSCFAFVIEGSIEITPIRLQESDVSVVWEKVYNVQNQNVDVYVFGNLLNSYYTVKKGTETFTGATNVDTYNDITVTINYPNYMEYVISGSFVIRPYVVYIDVLASNISKVYDGSNNLKTLINGTDYKLYENAEKSEPIKSVHNNNINNNSLLWFNFNNSTAGINKLLVPYTTSTNYAFNLINLNMKGDILKKEVDLKINLSLTKVFDDKGYEVNANIISAPKLISGEVLTGTLTIDIIDAGIYSLETVEIDKFILNNLTIDTNLFTVNYELTKVEGNLTINKADINVVLNSNRYEYTAKVQDVEFIAVRSSDGADVTDILFVASNDGVVVGTHSITLQILDQYINNYNYTSKSYTFTIFKKEVELRIDALKVYDGNVFVYYLAEAHDSLLCAGHTFGSSYIATVNTYAYAYTTGLLNRNVDIFDSNNQSVLSNYNITFIDKLTIGKKTISESDIIKTYKTYNGEIRDIEFTVIGEYISFEGKIDYGTSDYIYTNGDKNIKVRFALRTNGAEDEDVMTADFKYAGIYKINLTSNIFHDFSFDLVINPKEITSVTAQTTKVYDGTFDVIGGVNTDQIFAVDEEFVELHGQYKAIYGPTEIGIEFRYNNPQEKLPHILYQLLKGSYVLAENLALFGEITSRAITLTYSPNIDHYYTGEKLILGISNEFTVDNMASGETLGGTMEFIGIINAGDYDLSEQEVNLSSVAVNGPTYANISHYTITIIGDITLNKAQLNVSLATDLTHVYSDEAKSAQLTAVIVSGRGAIANGIENGLLYANYKVDTNESFVDVRNAGIYYIYPTVNVQYMSNYEYVGSAYLENDKLEILKRDIEFVADKEVVYSETKNYFELWELDTIASNIVSGHRFSATLTIDPYSANRTYYYTGEQTSENVSLTTGPEITKGASENVTANYNFTFNITIRVVETITDGQFRALAKQNYEYNSENQLTNIEFIFEIGVDGQVLLEEISSGNSGYYAEVMAFYTNINDARNDTNSISVIKNVGEYFARILVDMDGSGNFAGTTMFCTARVEIVPKTIRRASLTYNGIAFIGLREFNNSDSIILDSTDIYEVDQPNIEIIAVYYTLQNAPTSNVGSNYIVRLSMTDSSALGNYILDASTMDGSITPKSITIYDYIDSDIYRYKGLQTITISATKFEADNLLAGHELIGDITLDILNAGEYLFVNGVNNLGVEDSGDNDVSSNYIINISETLKFVMQKALVEISWIGTEFTYTSFNLSSEVINALSFTGDYLAGVPSDLNVQFKNEEGDVVDIINAGLYTIDEATLASNSGNFEYFVSDLSNPIVVNKKDITIDLGMKELKWKEYNTDGYSLTYSMISGGYPSDEAMFNLSVYKILGQHVANTTYFAQTGTDSESEGKFIKYNSIEVVYAEYIVNNYNCTEIIGGIKILPEVLVFEEVAPLTYNGQNRYSEIEVAYAGEDGVRKVITSADATYGTISVQEIIDAGAYTLEVVINTAKYSVAVIVNPKSIIAVDYSENKQYDGSSVVYNAGNGVNLTSPDIIPGDDIVINGTYADFVYSEQAYAITFTKTGTDSDNYILPTNHTGKILKRVISLNFGSETLLYQLDANYQVEYKGSATLVGGEITSNVLKFTLKNNEVNNNISVTNLSATINYDEFKIEKNGTDVTNCYNITIQLSVNIIAKEFVVEFKGYENNQVEFDATEKIVTIEISGKGAELTDRELNVIMSAISIEYKDVLADDVLATGIYPTNVGKYMATAVYSGSNCFMLAGSNEYTYEILQFTYNVAVDQITKFTKEYASLDPELTQLFTQDFDGISYVFTIKYARETGEDIGKYNLLLQGEYCDSKNINFVCDPSELADKFEIVKNTSSIVKITIEAYNNGDFVRYFGLKNIGLFDISDFTYTTTLLGQDVNGGITTGTVLYNSGNAGRYTVNSCLIESTNFTRFEIISDILFEIKPRTLVVSAQDYNKAYDATPTFVNALSYEFNSIMAEGVVDAEDISAFGDIVVAIRYASSDVGTHVLTATLSTHINNFVVVFEQATGTINPLDISVVINSQSIIYGEAINIDYSVSAIGSAFTSEQLKTFVNIEIVGMGVSKSTAGLLKVGTYQLNAGTTSNFNLTVVQNGTLTITQKSLTISISPKPYKVQDGTTEIDLNDYNVIIDGAITLDIVNVVSAKFENKEVGLNKNVIFVLGGVDGANYKANTVKGDIGSRLITFEFNYYDYQGCPVSGGQVNGATTTIKTIVYNYYSSVSEQNPNSLPTPAFIGRGYEFIGWSLTTNISGKIDVDKKISEYVVPYVETITLYAIWDIQKFNINIYEAKYNSQEGTYNKSEQPIRTEELYYLSEIDPSLYSINLLHYSYVGYGIGNTNRLFTTNYQITGSVDLYLVYALDKHTVVIDATGGVFSNTTTDFQYQSAGKLSIELYYGQTIGEKYTQNMLERYLTATKTGYTFNSWQINGNNRTIIEIANTTVEADVVISASWLANRYNLILNAQDGKFELTNEQLTEGWSYVDGAGQKSIQIKVEYQTNIPRLLAPIKTYYAFAGYLDDLNNLWIESENTVWTTLGDISLYAIYEDLDYILTVMAENASVSIIVKDANGAVVNINNSSTENNKFVFNVKTSYSVAITANADQGYTFTSFVDAVADGNAVNNVYYIESFKGDREIIVNVEPNNNVITLKVNNNAFGYISVKLSDETGAGQKEITSKDADPTFTLKTGEAFIIEAVASEGYKIGKWNVDGSGILGELTTTQKTFSEFTTDVLIYVEFEAKDINITIINAEEKGSYVYGVSSFTTTQTVKARTGQDVVITVIVNYGYDIDTNLLEFITESENKGEIVAQKDGEKYVITLSKFTADGSITIPYITKKFTITIGYAEFDEIENEIIKVDDITTTVVTVNGTEKTVGDVLTEDYLTQIIVSPTYTKEGYTFYGYAQLRENSEFISILSGIDAQNNLVFNLEGDYNLYLVYQREEYTVTYKVSNIHNGKIKFTNDTYSSTKIIETVRYGRTTTPIEVVLTDAYRTFNGWYMGDVLATINNILPSTEIIQNTTFEARIVGTNETFNIEIYANSTHAVANDINDIITSNNAQIGQARQGLDNQNNIVIIVPISYEVGTEVDFAIAVNDYYQIIRNSVACDEFTFNLGRITPEQYNQTTPHVVNLALRYYSVEITSDQDKAATITPITTEVGRESNFNPNGNVLAIAYVKYGSTFIIRLDVSEGYTFANQEGNASFTFDNDNAILENITQNISIKLNFVKTQYKITFKTNYPTQLLGSPIENVVNKEFTFYIGQDETKLRNADGTEADLQELIESQTYIVENAVFNFEGWSVTEYVGALNTCYLFDEGGIYSIKNGVKTYGFNKCIALDENNDGIDDVEDGYVLTNLYGAWTIPTYSLNITYSPDMITYEGDYSIHFQSAMGLIFQYKGEGELTQDAIFVAEGVNVVMFTAPEISGYKYYGWKLSTESEIKQGYADFRMPRGDATIVLYYQFKVQVLIEETIAGVNTATVNTQKEIWCLVGETLSLTAIAGEGYVFKCWKLDGVQLQEIGASFTISATAPAIYTAVFGGKEVEVILRNVAHTTLGLGVVSAEDGETVTPIVNTVKVGDKIRITVEEIEYGFKLQAISVNNSTNDINQNPAGTYYEYLITQADGEAGIIYIDTVVEARDVQVKFEININGSAQVFANSVDVSVDSTKTYAYNDNVNLQIVVQARYGLLGLSVNGQNKDLSTSIILNLTQEQGFKTGELNIIKLDFERLYWIDLRQSLVGYGTKEAPYLIPNAESLAYMAYAINNGIIDQSLNRLYYKVTADIDLTERFWIPIGTEEKPFDGIFILGKFTINGASFAEQYYLDEDWSKLCPGVFGYVSSNAKLVIEQSILPTIILLIVIGASTILLIIIFVIIRKKRVEKVKRHSGNLGVSSATAPSSQKTVDKESFKEDQQKEQMDNQVQEILKQAEEKKAIKSDDLGENPAQKQVKPAKKAPTKPTKKSD